MRQRGSSGVRRPHLLDIAPLLWMKEIRLHDRCGPGDVSWMSKRSELPGCAHEALDRPVAAAS
jgi:hypothetical protein